VDDTTLVANLVYGGTFVVGSLVLFILAALLIGMMLLAGVVRAILSLASRARRPFLWQAQHSAAAEAAVPSDPRNAALLEKANAILAALHVGETKEQDEGGREQPATETAGETARPSPGPATPWRRSPEDHVAWCAPWQTAVDAL
jgi:hypothetical protein